MTYLGKILEDKISKTIFPRRYNQNGMQTGISFRWTVIPTYQRSPSFRSPVFIGDEDKFEWVDTIIVRTLQDSSGHNGQYMMLPFILKCLAVISWRYACWQWHPTSSEDIIVNGKVNPHAGSHALSQPYHLRFTTPRF